MPSRRPRTTSTRPTPRSSSASCWLAPATGTAPGRRSSVRPPPTTPGPPRRRATGSPPCRARPLPQRRPDVVDPISLGAIAGVAITEGIKFLYNQADAILTRRAERKRAKKDGAPPPEDPIPGETPPVLEGRLAPLTVDDAAADEHAEQLKALRGQLEDYARGYNDVDEGGPEVVRATLALRDAIEDI